MKAYPARVLGSTQISAHLIRVTMQVEGTYASTRIPDEYIRVLIPPQGATLALPSIDDKWNITYAEGAVEPDFRVYTIADFRIVDGQAQIDVEVALHDEGIGSDWAKNCRAGDEVGVIEPHGLYAAPADVGWQLLVADITGLPAVARILRELAPGQRADVHMVLTDPDDEMVLPSAAEVSVTWEVVGKVTDLCEALAAAVTSRDLPHDDRYVWFAGEARASRAVRRHLRRELKWPQTDFYTCGYWQIDAAKWNARYEEVADEVMAKSQVAHQQVGEDHGAYLDALDDIYESVGL